jgi:hypothetical protein
VRPAVEQRRGHTLLSWGAAGLLDLREGHTKAQSLTTSPCTVGAVRESQAYSLLMSSALRARDLREIIAGNS